jgi:hypothetical protein
MSWIAGGTAPEIREMVVDGFKYILKAKKGRPHVLSGKAKSLTPFLI